MEIVTGAEGLILDNDGLFEVTVAAQSSTVTEGQDAVFTLTRAEGENLSAPLTVSFTVTGGDAVLTGAPPTSATFGAGVDTVRVTLATANDTTDEPNATLTLTLAESNAYFLDRRMRDIYPGPIKPREATVTVQDDDDPPTVSIADAPAVVEGETMEFPVSLSHASDEEITVIWQATEVRKGTADYNEQSGTVIFPPGVTELTIPFTTEDDSRDEQRGTNKAQMYVTWFPHPPAVSEVRVLDNDGLFDVTVAAETAAVTEGRYVSFLLTRTEGEDLSTPLTVSFTVSGGDAVLTDAAPTSVTFQRGVDKVRVTLATANDRTDEPDATLTLTLAESDAYFLGEGPPVTFAEFPPQPREATATVRDDDDPPTVSIADAPAVKEGGTLEFPVRLTNASATEIRVDYTLGGTATAGTDYTDRGSGTVTFAPGVIEQTIRLATIEDDAFETADETVDVTLSAPATGTASLGAATATGTIRNDDHEISFGAGTNGQENHATDGNVPVRFKVVLDPPADVQITVQYETFDDTATAGEDYEATNGTLTFAANETEKTVEVRVIDDDIVEREEHERVGLRLSNVSASPGVPVAITAAEETRTIASEDLYVLSFDSPGVAEGHSGTTDLTFTASLSKAADFDVRMNLLTHAGGAATAGEDYVEQVGDGTTFAPSQTFAPGETEKTVTVSVTGDNEVEPDETVRFKGLLDSHCFLPENPLIDCFVEPGRHEAIATGTIRNDDHEISFDSPKSSFGYEYDELLDGPRSIKFNVVLNPPAPAPVTVRYETVASTSPDAATSGVDYTPTDGTLTFAPGDMTKTVEVVVLDDDIVEQSENVVLRLSNASTASEAIGVAIADAELRRSITSDDEYALSVDSPSVFEGRSGTTALTFTVSLSRQATFQLKAGFSTGGGTATAGEDYVAITDQELTFPAGVTEQQVAVTVNGDTVREPDEMVDVTVTLRPGYAFAEKGGDTATGTGTILNDDYELSIDSPSVSEGHSGTTDLTFTVTLSSPVPDEVRVNYATSDGEGRKAAEEGEQPNPGGEDYEPARDTLVFPADTATRTITVTVNGDGQYEFDEVMKVELSNPDGPEGSSFTIAGAGVGTIVNDDVLTYTIRDVPMRVLEGSRNGPLSDRTDTQEFLRFYADLNQEVFLEGETFCLLEEGTAKGGETSDELNARDRLEIDYIVEPQQQGFNRMTGLQHIGCRVTILSDDRIEPDETVNVYFYAPDLGFGTKDNPILMGTGTIVNDDHALSIDSPSVEEGDAGTTGLEFTVTLAPPSTGTVTVDYLVGDGSATSGGAADEGGDDYDPGQGTLTFGAGETERKIAVTVNGDETDERDETVTVTLSDPEGPGAPEQQDERTRFNSRSTITVPEAPATGTITDDDGPPAVTLNLDPASISENGGTSTVTATLNRPSSEATTVTVSATPVDPAVAGDYTLSPNTTLTIPAGQTTSTGVVTITAVNNDVQAADKTVTVSATAKNDQEITAPEAVTLTITDDDTPTVTLHLDPASISENGGTSTVTATLDRVSSEATTVTVSATPVDPALAGDYMLSTTTTLTILAGETDSTGVVTITAVDNDVDAADKTVTVSATAENDQGITAPEDVTLTITDDDDAPAVTLVLTPTSISENGGKSTVTATLDHPSSQATTVTVSAAPVDPAVEGDYTLSTNKTLTIAAGETTSTGEVTITAVNNDVDALDKTVTVSATATNDLGITAPQDVTLTITDDDAPALSVGDASVNEGDSGESPTLTFTVTLDPAATLPVTVDWKTADGTAIAGTDYTAANGSLRFDTGDDTKTVTVTVTGDDTDEPNETITVTLTNESGATLGDATGTGTITDDDDAPTVTLVLTPASITEAGGKSTVTATLDHPSSEATTVTVSADPVDPAVSGDYTLSTNTTLTIPADSLASTGTVTITAVNNDVDALDKEVTVSATAENSQGVTAPDNVTLTITDDDAPELTIDDASVGEGDEGESATLSFTVTLSPAATLPVTVDWKTDDGTATAGTDYTTANGSLRFNTGDETKTVTVTVTGDDADEPNETITVTLSNESGATLGDATGTGTITDDDDAPTVTLVLTPDSIGEAGGKSTVTATLDHPSSEATTVTVSTTPVSPAVANDYTLSTNKTVTIAAGATTSTGTVTITATDNSVDAADKTVTVSATATNSQGITAPPNVTLTITDDDAPELSIGDASVDEGNEGESPTLTFTVTLTPAATLPVTVDWETADGTAEAGTDYTAANGSLKFDTGDETKTITVTVTGDDADEPNETLTVTLTNESGATLTDATGTGTITDDDDAPTVTLVLTPDSIGENGGKSTVTATLDRPSSQETTVTVAAAPVDPAVAGDYTLVGSQLTIAADSLTSTGEVTITAVDNDVDALDKEVTVSATAENTQGITAPQNATLTITDDDAPALAIGDASVAEGDEGESATLSFTVTLSPAATLPVTVDWATADGTAEAGTDYMAGEGTLSFNEGDESKTITVTVTGDDADEPNETFEVRLLNESGATLGDATATGTITDDDGPPAVTLVLTPASIGENGGKSTVTATLDHPSSQETTVTVSAAPVDPAVSGDYTLSTNLKLTIPADSLTSTGEVTITAVDNDVDALDKEVTVSATAENTQGITAPQNATLTITDDDAPALAIGDASVAEGDEGESATLSFTVTLSPAATLPVTVDWATADGTAEAGTDYMAGEGTLSFNEGDESKTITVTVTGDDADEPNETFEVRLLNESGATLGDATATGTITDDDGPPAVTLVLTPTSISENGGRSTVTATLDRPSSQETTVTVSAAPVDPAVSGDYTLSTNLKLTIPAGSLTSTGEVTITAVDNDVDALDKEVTVSATATNSQGVTAPDNVTLTITDDDAPELTIDDASVAEGDEGESATLSFTVTLSPAATLPVTVDWATSDGTATTGTDYTTANGSLRFTTGDETKTVTVTVTGDDADEPNETITVTLTNESGATLGKATGTGTITDDDDAPTVTLVLTPTSISENGGKSTVTATLDRASSAATTVTVSATPVSPAVANDYTLSGSQLTIAAGETTSTGEVTITAADNAVDAMDKEVTVSATATNPQGITAPPNVTLTITDDDAPELSIDDASVTEGNQGTSATLTFTVTLDPAATLPVTVDWATADGTAIAGTDYTAANGSLRFDTGDETKTVTVTVTGDDADEPNETITVTLSNESGATLGDATGTGTITDDDDAPTVTLVLTPASIGEAGGKSTVTATLDHPSSRATTVTVSADPVDPAVSGDYTLSTNTTLTIAAGEKTSTGEVTITAVDNDVDALNKTVTVSGTAKNTQGITAPQNVTLTITDDDAPELSIADASVAEGNSGESATLTFTVTLTPAATLPVTVDWKTADGTAEAGTDYTAGSGTLTFETGDESQTISVTVTGDDADEPNETFTVTLSNAPGATLGDATGTGTITDDDDEPTVTLVLTPASIGEAGGKSTVTATLDHPSSEATTVTVSVTPVSPAVSGDYTLSSNKTLTVAAGVTTSTGAVTITAVNNDMDALDKTVTVSATATNTQGITAPQNVTLTIADDDAPELSIADASVAEGNSGESATLTFTVTLSPAATLPVTVDWKTADGTAEAGTDYTAGSGTLTFETGDESQTISVTVTGDDADEPNETLTVTLSNAPGATLADATATGTITDDDDAPTVTLVLTPDSITEAGGKSTVTATLEHPSSEATTVTVSATPVDPALASDYTLSTNTTLTIAAGETTSTGVVTITAVDNDVDALNKEVTVSATATNSQGGTAPQDATLTITDDDAPDLSIGDASVTEGDSGGSATLRFTVTLTPAATLPVTVDWKTADGTATAGTDYTAGNGSLRFDTGDETKTVTVTVTGDDMDEPNEETFTVALSNESGATLAKGTGTGTITDDDGAPTVTLVLTPASITENGGTSTVTATLDHPSSEATTVTVSAVPVDPAVAGDYTLSTNTTLTIAAGATTSTGEVTITAADNAVDALDKEVTVSATATNTQGITAPDNVTLTITDDDMPALSIGDASVTEGDEGDSPTLTFTVTLAPAATLPVTVDWQTADGTATAGTDYTAGNGTLTFGTGDDSKTITVTVTGDDADEPNENFTVTLSNAPSATITDATGTGTITDDDGPPAVTLVLAPASIGENGEKSTVTATLDRASSAATTVTVSAAPVTPAVAGDYTLSGSELTIAAGQTTSTGEVTITAVNNDVDALDKTVTVSGTATNSQGITAPDNVALTITDDDAPVLSIGDASVTEGDAGKSATLTFTVTLTPPATLPVTVDWATADGTATAGTDYTAANGSLTFNTGENTKTITVAVTGDDTDEPNETVTVTLTNESGATLTDATGTGTITDDDGPPAVTLVLAPASIGENGGTSTVTATLDRASSAATTVTVSAAPVTPAVAGDYTLSGSELTIAAGQTTSTGEVTITAVNNDVDALDKTVTVSATATNSQGITAPQDATLTITDDDAPALSIDDASVTEGNAGESATLTFTVTLAPAATLPVTVDWTTADGTAEAGTDYTAGTGSLRFDTGEESKTITVTVTGDDADEPNETLTVTLSNESGATLTDGTGTGTITDDDGPPAVTLVLTPASIGEDGGTSTVTATLDRASSAATTVTVSVVPVSPATANDYTLSLTPTLTIAAGQTTSTGEVTITAVDNDVDALDKTVTVSATATNSQGVTAPQDVTLTITDDEVPVVTVAAETATVTEGAEAAFTLTRDGDLSATLDVTFAVTDGGGVLSGEPPTEATFGANAATVRVALATEDDQQDEPNATLTLALTDGADYDLGTTSDAEVTVEDNDDAPTVTLVLTPATIGENGGKSTVTATLDRPSSAATTVTVSAAPVTPAVSGDYTLSANKTLTIAAGQTTSTDAVTITATDNTVYEGDKTVTVSATAENDQGVTAPDNVTLTITEDDSAPVVTVAAETDTVTEGEDAVFILTRASADIATSLVVDFTLADPDTVLDQAAPATATIPANETTVKVTLATDDDAVHEEAATLTLTLTDGAVYDLGSASSATITVQDNDPPGQESESDAAVTVASDGDVAEGADAQFTLTRTGTDLAGALVVHFTLADPAAVLDQQVPTTATIPANETTVKVTLATDDDNVDEPDAKLTLTVIDGTDYYPDEPSEATVTVEDEDDAPMVTLVLTPASIGEAGGKSTVTATLDHPSSEATTVTVSAAPVSPAVANDYTLAGSQLTIPAGETDSTGVVTITAVNNDVDALNKEVTVSATVENTQGVTAPQDVMLTITDDDAPALSIADASVDEGDAGESATLTFTVTLTPAATLPVTVDWKTADGTAEAGTDYTAGNGTLTFGTGEESKTFTVTVTGDDADEPNETFTVTLSNESGATITDATGTGTITDDDGPPAVTLVLTPASIGENGGKSTVTATLDRASSAATTVTVSVTPVSPAVANDYTLSPNLTLTIPADSLTSTGAVTITAADNTVYEGDKTVTVSATAENGQGVTAPDNVTLTITEDDAAPVVTVAAETATITEGEDAVFILTRASADITTPLVVDFTVADPNTVLDQAAPATATIPASETTVKVTLATDDDATHEADAPVTLTVTDGAVYDLGSESSATVTVEDNDPPGRVSAADAAVTVAADEATITEGADAVFTLTRTGSASEELVVTIAVTGGGGVLADEPPTKATFGVGAATTQVTLATAADEVDEPDATVTLTLTDGDDYYPGDPAEAGITVEDDDATPTVTLVLTSDSISEDGGKSTVTATLDHPSSQATTVTVSAAPVDPAVAGDYTLSPNTTLTIPAGETDSEGVVTVTAKDNDVDALDKTVTVSATATNSQGITAPPNVTLTITDDDAPALSIGDASVDEGDEGESATLEFTVTLTPAATLPVTVDWKTADGTATAGTDYTAGNGSLTFAAGDDSKTFTVTVTGDDADEPNETLTVTLTNAPGATITDATGTGTITDDDGPPAVTLVLTPASITEAGGKSTVTATLDRPSSAATTVTVTAAPVTGDYTLVGSQLTIAADSLTSTGVVTITAVNNDVDALDKEVTVSATATNSQGITAPQDVTLTIEDDDAPEMSIGDASVGEGDEGESATLEFTVTLTPAATLPVTVDWKTADGTATAGTDYTAGNGSLRFDTGDETKTVTVTVTGDDMDEPNEETFTVTLSNAPGATLGDATGTGTITDDDDEPTVTLVLTPASIGENGGKSTVTATLDHPSSEATTVTVSADPVDPAVSGDYTLSTNKTLTIAAGQTTSTGEVTITAVDNDVDALNKEVTVSATATNAQGITAPQNVTLTITDDDAPELSISDASVTEGDSGESPTLEFTVTLTPAATLPVTVDWGTSDGTAEPGRTTRLGTAA